MKLYDHSKSFGPIPHQYWECVETPVGEICYHCNEPIADGDSGYIMPIYGINGLRMQIIHRECFLRELLGSLGHQQKKCSCHGGTEEDPPNMTTRQAAQAAVDYWELNNIPHAEIDDT